MAAPVAYGVLLAAIPLRRLGAPVAHGVLLAAIPLRLEGPVAYRVLLGGRNRMME